MLEKGNEYFFRSFETARRDIIREHGFRYIEYERDTFIRIERFLFGFCIAWHREYKKSQKNNTTSYYPENHEIW